MKFTKPTTKQFTITDAPEWPSIQFATDGTGAHVWSWTITWGTFTKSGKENTAGNTWDAKDVVTDLGGELMVTAEANKTSINMKVQLTGTNPTVAAVKQYLATKSNSGGFDKIIEHENNFRHFKANGEPAKSFDNGYGMCQLTSPKPTFDQVWNWKKNIDGGLSLFQQKVTSAIAYLAQGKRSYTSDQLKYESVCRWNGGSYHTWDATAGKWVRNPSIVCDVQTGNIGWDMDDTENKGKTAAELRERDKGSYKSRPKDAHWKYLGVCYADSILG